MKKAVSILLVIVMNLLFVNSSLVLADQLNEGVYNFECVAGGRYMNVYAGNDWDGANVCVWDKDGSPEQNFKLTDRGGNRYVLYPQSSNGRVLDANRGNSYNNPLQAGNNIDIWQTNDAPAQEWYIDDRGDGKYTIELVNARGLVVTCDNPWGNNGNCSLQKYTGAENQLWYLKRPDGGAIKPESTTVTQEPAPAVTTRTGYVANTGGVVLRVRAEANTNCAVLGTLNEGTPITVEGNDKINGFWKVYYNNGVGYCHGDYISFNQQSVTNNSVFIKPVNGVISCGFYGYYNHGGTDFAVPMGTSVKAAKSGVVSISTSPCPHNYGKNGNFCYCSYGYGNYVKINHGDGTETLYAHLTSTSVSVGQQVSQGQEIGKSGTTGNSTGPHLHFEIRVNGVCRNPEDYLN